MTQEFEKQAEEYTEENGEKYNAHLSSKRMIYLSFQDGAKWGMEHAIQWHDLRKNSNDLPKEVNKFIIIALYNCITEEIITTVGTYEEFGNILIGNVIAWCELPQFKE